MLADCSAKQTKTGRPRAMIKEINKSSAGHEHMGLQAGSGYLERVSQRRMTMGACEEGKGATEGPEVRTLS